MATIISITAISTSCDDVNDVPKFSTRGGGCCSGFVTSTESMVDVESNWGGLELERVCEVEGKVQGGPELTVCAARTII